MKSLLISLIIFATSGVAMAHDTLENLRDGSYPCGPAMVKIEGTLNDAPIVRHTRTYFENVTVSACTAIPLVTSRHNVNHYTGSEACEHYPNISPDGLHLNFSTRERTHEFNQGNMTGRHFLACGKIYHNAYEGVDYMHFIHPGNVAGWFFIQHDTGTFNGATQMDQY